MTEQRSALAVVGDIHGDAERLRSALKALLSDCGVHVIFVGDYVNRGPDSRGVLDLLLAARSEHSDRVTLLRGNHEQALLTYLDGGSLADFAAHGGLATVRSYLRTVRSGALDEFKAAFPSAHRLLLESTVQSYEDVDVLVSHAGFDPADPWSRTPHALYNGHPGLFEHQGPWPRPLTVCGHYVQFDGQPHESKRLVCLDTGCGTLPGAPLTVYYLPERKFRQF